VDSADATTGNHPLARRRGGVLCHISSLPGAHRGGTLGTQALRFLDFMARAGLTVWQVLPLNPPDRFGSPYHSASLFALHEGLVDPALDVTNAQQLRRYTDRRGEAFERFLRSEAYWLTDYCRFRTATVHHGADWYAWPEGLRSHDAQALARFDRRWRPQLEAARLAQFAVHDAVTSLREEAASRGVLLFGDMPLYPAYASADVWAHQALFELDDGGRPRRVAGVPPDYFSADGQLWGNPLYDWQALARTDYAWWTERLAAQLRLLDVVRIDHFRGLEAYWAVPRDAASAVSGAWCTGPGDALLRALRARWDPLPVVAEDLGIITPQVTALREAFALPGMRVLQFAFSGDSTNPHLPANYVAHTVAYTGTHDNDTTVGWYESLDAPTRGQVAGVVDASLGMPWSLIDAVFRSRANTAIVPMQDYLGLDSTHRMNTPGVAAGNWRWQMSAGQMSDDLAQRIRAMLQATGRA
jgi:4-alpha-glucanotransferase